ncbi:hypothetical protein Tco_0019003 [Tanacetum coccineum]|uniref:Uncharacterized protein n=1 Tax=Tanacetum coccineum TaxID=301880 RepID=A0ABQ4ZEI2_9ASTR
MRSSNKQLDSEVLVRSSKEANTSHAIAANLSELELKKILIDKMEANNSINRSHMADTVTNKKDLETEQIDDQRNLPGKTTTTGSKTHKQSASQSAPVKETMQTTDVFEAPAHQEFETGVHDEQAHTQNVSQQEEVQHLLTWFQQTHTQPSPDQCNGTKVYKPNTEKIGLDNPEKGRQYPHDLRTTTTVVPNYQAESHIGEKSEDSSMHLRPQGNQLVTFYSKKKNYAVTKMDDFHRLKDPRHKKMPVLLAQGESDKSSVEEQKMRRFTPYSDPRGFIYENKDKKKRFMGIDELNKFSDGTLDDVRDLSLD